MLILWSCALIAIVVLGAIVYSVAKFRHADANTAVARRHPRKRELLWALLPTAIVIAAAAPAVRDAEPQLAQRNLDANQVIVALADHPVAATRQLGAQTHR
jgi:heme/copper-type cytochrome/quinol oxidase subunit 2